MTLRVLPGRCPVLVERDEELALVLDVAEHAASGTGALLLITGEAGAGKTRLLAECVSVLGANWRLCRVESEDIPSQALADEPTLIVIEDLHERDPSVFDVLREVVHSSADQPALVLATYRLGARTPGSPWAAGAASLLRDQRAGEIRLRPLSVDGVAEMITALGGAPDDVRAREMHARTAGNPFFVEQLATQRSGSELPWTVSEAIHSAVSQLSSAGQEAARALAIARRPVASLVLGSVVGMPGVQELSDSTVGESDDSGIRLRHALVADALDAAMPAGDRAAMARRLADALLASGAADQPLLVRLLAEAGDTAGAARLARDAVTDLMERGLWRTARDVFDVVLAHPRVESLERATDLELGAVIAARAGDLRDARDLARRASGEYRESTEPWRAEAVWFNPALRFVPRPDESIPPEGGAMATFNRATEALRNGQRSEAVALAVQVCEQAIHPQERSVAADATDVMALAGDTDAAAAALDHLRREAYASGDSDMIAASLAEAAHLRRGLGEDAEGIALLRESVREASRNKESWIEPHVRSGLAGTLAGFGHIGEAERLGAPLLALEDPFLRVVLGDHVFTLIDAYRGDQVSAAQRAARLMQPSSLQPDHFAAPIYGTVAMQRLAADDARGAAELVERLRDTVLYGFTLRSDLLLLEALVFGTLGDINRLERTSAEAASAARSFAAPAHQAGAAVADAMLERVRGGHIEAAIRFRSAAELYARSPRVAQATRAWLEAAISFDAAGERRGAVNALDEAEAIADAFGLLAFTTAARHVRDRLGATASPLSSLSRREREIAQLVATGRSNKEIAEALFMAEKTVRNRLSVVFTKLGLTSRAELAALVGEAKNRDI